jgi:hypothetical protein
MFPNFLETKFQQNYVHTTKLNTVKFCQTDVKHFSLNFKKHFALSWKLSNLSNVLLLLLQTKIGNFKLPFQEQNLLKVTFYAVKIMEDECVNKLVHQLLG